MTSVGASLAASGTAGAASGSRDLRPNESSLFQNRPDSAFRPPSDQASATGSTAGSTTPGSTATGSAGGSTMEAARIAGERVEIGSRGAASTGSTGTATTSSAAATGCGSGSSVAGGSGATA